ncbi:acid phosphatase 1-like [Canna indica]|uniref:Acid phosphatase 1-like n=1 Tax=Canna indica TaxID=4628 RepID=A0AAQ3KDL8_9LILI|nr:acid phosphatase 1-like [Canna indica]
MASEVSYCLSWRVAVEANNARGWRIVPSQCVRYVENYMLGGQYSSDVDAVVDQMASYLEGVAVEDGEKDAWILDVDDTCLSNLPYYRERHFGGEPFDSASYKNWVMRGVCPAIPAVLGIYEKLIERRFHVFLVTGRDEELLGACTAENLAAQGFVGHQKLIMRSRAHRGHGAVPFKSAIRRQLVAEGYRIRGNVGDQWSDLLGDCVGDRTFKIPNPMYFVP